MHRRREEDAAHWYHTGAAILTDAALVSRRVRRKPIALALIQGFVENVANFPEAVNSRILTRMSTLHEIENIVAQFSPEELAELERVIRQLRLLKIRNGGQSALDLPPLDLGHVLHQLGTREEWYDEMLEGRM